MRLISDEADGWREDDASDDLPVAGAHGGRWNVVEWDAWQDACGEDGEPEDDVLLRRMLLTRGRERLAEPRRNS